MLKNKDSINESKNVIDSTEGNTYSHDNSNVAKNIDAHEIHETPRNSSYIGHIAKETLGLFIGHGENGNKKERKDGHNVENNQDLKNTNEQVDTTGNASYSNYTYSSIVDPVINKNDVIQSENNVQERKQRMKTGEYDSIKKQQNQNTLSKESETHITNPPESKQEGSDFGGSDSHNHTGSHSRSSSGHGILKKLGIHRRSKSESSSDKKNSALNTSSQNDDTTAGNSSDKYFEPTQDLGIGDSHGGRRQDIAKSPGDFYDQTNQGVENADKNQAVESSNDLYDNQELKTPGNTYKTGFESSVNEKKVQDTKASRTSDNPHHTPLDEFAMKDQYAKQHEQNIKDRQKGEVVDADDYLHPAPVCKNIVPGVDPVDTNLNTNVKNEPKDTWPTYDQKDLNDQPLAPVLESLRLNESKETSGDTDELSTPNLHNLHNKNIESVTNPTLKHEDGTKVEEENENQGILGTIYGYLGMQNDENGEDQNINPDHLETNIPGSYYDYKNIDTSLGDQTKGHFGNEDDRNFEESGTYAMRAGDNSRTDPMQYDKMAGAMGESTPYHYIQDPSDENRLVSEDAQDLKASNNLNAPLMAGSAADTTILKTKADSNQHPTVEPVNNAKRYFDSAIKNPTKDDMLSGATVESTPYRMIQDPNHKEYLQTKNANLLKSKKGVNDSHIGTSDLISKDKKSKNYYKLKRDTVSDPVHHFSESADNRLGGNTLRENNAPDFVKGSGSTGEYQDLAKAGRGEGNNEFNSKNVTDNIDTCSDYNTENKKDENWLSYILGRGNNHNAEEPSDFATKTNDDNDYKLKESEMNSAEADASVGLGAGVGLRINKNSNIEDDEVLRESNAQNDEQRLFKKTPVRYKENRQYGLQEYKIGNSENQKGFDIKQSGSDDLLYSDRKRNLDYNVDPKQIIKDDKYDSSMNYKHISDAVPPGAAGGTVVSGSYNTYPKNSQLKQNVATNAKTTSANTSNITDYNNKYGAGNAVTVDAADRINDTSMTSGGYQRSDGENIKDAEIDANQSNTGGIAIASGGDNGHGHHLTENMQSSTNTNYQKTLPIKSQDSDYKSHRKMSSSGGGKNKLMALFGKDNKNNTDVQDVEKTPIKTRGTKYGVIHDEDAKALKESIKSPSAIGKVNNDEYDHLTGSDQVGRRKSWIEKIKDKVT